MKAAGVITMASQPANLPSTATTASVPRWSPQQQTARMLALCEAQMEAATHDADVAVDTLAQSFTELVNTVRNLGSLSQQIANEGAESPRLAEVQQRCDTLSKQIASAVVAFQFYDKLSQRLGHVRYSMSTLALFICDPPNSQKPEHWEKLLSTLGRLYRTTEERAVFDALAGSLSLTAAESQRELKRVNSAAGSVELF